MFTASAVVNRMWVTLAFLSSLSVFTVTVTASAVVNRMWVTLAFLSSLSVFTVTVTASAVVNRMRATLTFPAMPTRMWIALAFSWTSGPMNVPSKSARERYDIVLVILYHPQPIHGLFVIVIEIIIMYFHNYTMSDDKLVYVKIINVLNNILCLDVSWLGRCKRRKFKKIK